MAFDNKRETSFVSKMDHFNVTYSFPWLQNWSWNKFGIFGWKPVCLFEKCVYGLNREESVISISYDVPASWCCVCVYMCTLSPGVRLWWSWVVCLFCVFGGGGAGDVQRWLKDGQNEDRAERLHPSGEASVGWHHGRDNVDSRSGRALCRCYLSERCFKLLMNQTRFHSSNFLRPLS